MAAKKWQAAAEDDEVIETELRRIAPAPVETDRAVIELLEELLADAQSGKILGVAIVAERLGLEFGTHHAGSACRRAVPFLAFTRVLQMEIEDEIRSAHRAPSEKK